MYKTERILMTSVNKILTEQEFNKSPLKGLMSYQEYFDKALKSGSTFTFAKKMNLLETTEKTTKDIEASVKGFYLEREKRKNEAEEKYYAALEQYEAMKSSQNEALKKLQYATNIYGENSLRYSDALKKYNLSSKTLFNADVNLSCARDQFNFANGAAFKAYLSTQLT